MPNSFSYEEASAPAGFSYEDATGTKKGNLSRGAEVALRQIPQTIGGAIGLAGDALGAKGVRDYGMGIYEGQFKAIQAMAQPSDSFSNVLDGTGSLGEFLPYATGYVGGQAATALATGGVGGFVGRKLAERGVAGLTAEAAKQALQRGTAAGAGTALGGYNFVEEAGSIYPDAVEQAQKEGRTLTGGDLARVTGAAALAAGVETLTDTKMLKGVLHGASDAPSLAGRAVRTIPAAAAREAGTEAVQTGIERVGAEKSLTDSEAIRDYVDSAALGGVGGAYGGTAGALNRKAPPAVVIDPNAGPTSRAAALLAAPTTPAVIRADANGTAIFGQDLANSQAAAGNPGAETGVFGQGRNSQPLEAAAPPALPALPFDNSPTGVLVAGPDGILRPELRPEAVQRNQEQDAQREARNERAHKDMELGLPGDTVEPNGDVTRAGAAFKTRIGAMGAAKRAGAGFQVEPVAGGYVVRRAPDQATDVEPKQAAAQRVADVTGDKIDDEWTAFAPTSGTKSIPRADMPQIKAEHRGAMVNFLAARGITHENVEIPAADLKPTQAEFSPDRVKKAAAFTGGERSILVSSDGHILDGTHQWLDKLGQGNPVKAIRLDAPIEQLIATVKEFPSAQTSDGATAPSQATAPDALAAAAGPAVGNNPAGDGLRGQAAPAIQPDPALSSAKPAATAPGSATAATLPDVQGKAAPQPAALPKAAPAPADILNAEGKPFRTRLAAMPALRNAGTGHEIAPATKGGFVVRPMPATPTIQGAEVSRFNGQYGKGMAKMPATLKARELNKTAAKGVTYTAEEHNDPKLENPWAVVGRKAAAVPPAQPASPALNASTPEGVTSKPKNAIAEGQARREAEKADIAPSPQVGTNLEKMRHHLKAAQIAGRKEGEDAKRASRAHHDKAMEFQALELAEKKAEATKAKRAATMAAKSDDAPQQSVIQQKRAEKAAEPAKPRKLNKLQQGIANAEAARASYFTPGNIVRSYGGFDEVISYKAPTQDDSAWSVTVHEVKEEGGKWTRVGREARTHSTQPEPRHLKNGPRAKVKAPAAAPEQATAAATAQAGAGVAASPVDLSQYRQARAAAQALHKAERDEILFDLDTIQKYHQTGAISEAEALAIVNELAKIRPEQQNFDDVMEIVDPLMTAAGEKYAERLNPANEPTVVGASTSRSAAATPEQPPAAEKPKVEEKVAAEPAKDKPIGIKALQSAVERLAPTDGEKLEQHYGTKQDSPRFWTQLREDVTAYVTRGAEAVAQAIRSIVKTVAEGVLAAGIVFNPMGMKQDFAFNLPKVHAQTIERQVEIKAEPPIEAIAAMSQQAIQVYEAMAPTAKGSGKGFIIADKPAGMIHVFKADGAALAQDTALYGKDRGDQLGRSSLQGGPKVTPAGTFTLRAHEDSDYKGGQMLQLVESRDASGAYVAVHSVWLGDPREHRAERLQSTNPDDKRASFGCINTTEDTFLNAILPNIESLNGGMAFVIPEESDVAATFPAATTIEGKTTFSTEQSADAGNLGRDQPRRPIDTSRATRTEPGTRRRKDDGATKETDKGVAMFKRDTTHQVGEAMSLSQVQAAVRELTAKWKNGPAVQVVANPSELGAKTPNDVRGLYRNGTMYVVAGKHQTLEQLARTIGHEAVAHYGLRTMLGREAWQALMDRIQDGVARGDRALVEIRDYVRRTYVDKDGNAELSPRLEADEIAARAVEQAIDPATGEFRPGFEFLKSVWAKVAAFLRDLGLTVPFTNAELQGMLVQAQKHLEVGKRSAGGGQTVVAAARDESQAPMAARGGYLGDLSPEQERALKAVGALKAPKTLAERFGEIKANLGLRITQGIFDQFAPIKDVSPEAYLMARLSKGSEGTMEAALLYGKPFLRDGVPDVDATQGGFAKVLAALKGEHDRFLWWVAAHRAEQLKKPTPEFPKGRENLFTDNDISALKSLADDKMADGSDRAAAYRTALAGLNDFNDSVLKMAVESGLIDEEARELFKGQPYVPFYRVMAEEMTGPRFSSGLVNQQAYKKLKGGTSQLNDDLLENMLLNWAHLYTAAARNRAALATMEAADRLAIAHKGEGKKAVKVMRNGLAEHWVIEDPYLLEAITALHYTPSPLMAPLAKMKQVLTFSVTVNPAFKVRNLLRDSISAMGQADLSYNPLKNVAQGWKSSSMSSQTYASMLASGGVMRFGSQENANRMRHKIEKLGGKMVDDSEWKSLTSTMGQLWDAYNDLGDRSENVNRTALYDQLVAKGKTHAEASFMARDLMDFSMSGKWAVVRFLTQTVPFLNARLQGIYKLGRAANEDPKRFATITGAVALASLALLAAYHDDDDWKKREDWDRDTWWWFKIGQTAYRIPKPFEIGAIGTLAERTAELMFSKEMTKGRFADRLAFMSSQTFSLNPVPQALSPLFDVYANRDAFTRRPIESRHDKSLLPQDRHDERTSEIARFLGQLGLPEPLALFKGEYNEVSPKQWDFLLRGYFSWVGGSIASVSDYAVRPMLDRGERPDTKIRGGFVEPLPSGGSRYVTAFYEQAKDIEEAFASYRAALKEGDTERAQKLVGEGKVQNHVAAGRVRQRLEELNAAARRVEGNRLMAGEAKRTQLDAIDRQRHEVARTYVQKNP